MEDTFVYSDLINTLWRLGLIGDPTRVHLIRDVYKNRIVWEAFYETCNDKRYSQLSQQDDCP